MKRRIGIIIIVLCMVLLTACGSKTEEKRVFELEELGITTTMTYYYKGDKVTRQQTKNVVPYKVIGVETKEEAQELFDPASEQMQGIEGLTEKVEYGDTEAVEMMEIDYETFDMDRLNEIPGVTSDGNVKNGISMKMSAEMLLEQGFTEK